MYRYDDVTIRKFQFEDIPLKIKWINDSKNNQFLHYDLPLEYEKTCQWFQRTHELDTRFDAVIEYEGEPVGLTGLLNIDYKNLKAEDYMIIGEHTVKGKGIAKKAGLLNQAFGFYELGLNKIVAYTEIYNVSALSLDIKRGFEIEGILKSDLIIDDRKIDRYILGSYKEKFILPTEVYEEEK